jgi:flagellar assembly factor FliW
MQLNTKHFGLIEYQEDEIIIFPEGILGLGMGQRYLLISEAPDDLFCWLQSVDNEDLALVLVDIMQLKPDYNPTIDKDVLKEMGESHLRYNIAVVPEDVQQMRVNLKAPILINKELCIGRQVISSNEEYGVRHYIFEEIGG